MRLEPAALRLVSSTLPLRHCAPYPLVSASLKGDGDRQCMPTHDWSVYKLLEVHMFSKIILDFSRWYIIANTRFWANQSIWKVWSCYVQPLRRNCIYKKVHYFTFDLDLRSWTNTKHCPVSSPSCDLCTCKVWSCFGQWLRRCITKKIHHLTLTPRSRSHKMLPSSRNFMWPLHQQNLMILHLMKKEKMNLQVNTLFDLDLGVKVTQKLPSTLDIMWPMHQQSLILLHPTVKKMHLQENTLFDLDLRVKVTRTVSQCPLHHVTYAPAKFDIATSHG